MRHARSFDGCRATSGDKVPAVYQAHDTCVIVPVERWQDINWKMEICAPLAVLRATGEAFPHRRKVTIFAKLFCSAGVCSWHISEIAQSLNLVRNALKSGRNQAGQLGGRAVSRSRFVSMSLTAAIGS
jgi:hypothetical protein